MSAAGENNALRVGICMLDELETFWWRADTHPSCPACRQDDDDYAANHRFFIGLRAMLAEFHDAIAHPDTDMLWLRRTLHDEEHDELVEALDALHQAPEPTSDHLAAIARELADIVYIAYGTAHGFNIDLDMALQEIHQANMQKAHGPRRPDGKALKPDGFIPPDMTASIREARP
jgi:predicted HAD superfamily Cof-like phosphohydrolase